MISLFFCYDKTKLMRPLGPWHARFSTRRRWPNYYVPDTDIINHQSDEGIYTDHKRVRYRVFSRDPCPPTPDDTDIFPVPIDVFPITDGWRISTYAQ